MTLNEFAHMDGLLLVVLRTVGGKSTPVYLRDQQMQVSLQAQLCHGPILCRIGVRLITCCSCLNGNDLPIGGAIAFSFPIRRSFACDYSSNMRAMSMINIRIILKWDVLNYFSIIEIDFLSTRTK